MRLQAHGLARPGQQMWMEDPGFPLIRPVVNDEGVAINPVPVDDDGMDISWAQRHYPSAHFALLTPAHQSPLGVALSLARRRQLLLWAAQNNAWIIEDDYDSEFRYRGKPLPYMPFCYQHPDYWHCIAAESKRAGDMVNSRKLFDDSETAHPIEPEEYIPVENIRGKLLLIGAEDDALWDTAKYIRRMEKRLAEKPHECEIETMVYAHGTHFVFPEGMLKIMLPVGSGLFVKFAFQAAKKYPKECRQTRIDIEKRMCRVLAEWKGAK